MTGDLPEYLIDAQREADEKQAEWAELDGRAKRAKKAWEASQEDVAKMIRDAASGQPHLPRFDGKDDSGDSGVIGGTGPSPVSPTTPPNDNDVIDVEFEPKQLEGPEGSVVPAPTKPVAKSDPEGWRVIPLSHLRKLGLAPGLVSKLEENGLRTIGDLSNWTNTGKQLDDIDGIGEAKAAEIMDCLDVFWAEWQVRDQVAAVPEKDEPVLTGDPPPKKKRGRKAG